LLRKALQAGRQPSLILFSLDARALHKIGHSGGSLAAPLHCMSSTAVVATIGVVLVIVVAIVVRMRAHRRLTTEEIVQLTTRIEVQTGVDPTKPQGFVLQPDGTWAPMNPEQTRKQP
jgi:hypothetical protein